LISHKPSRIAQVKNAEKAARVNYVFLGHTANIMWYLGRPAFPLFAFAVACNLQRGDEVAALRPKANPAWRCVTAHLCDSDGHRRGQYSLHPCHRRKFALNWYPIDDPWKLKPVQVACFAGAVSILVVLAALVLRTRPRFLPRYALYIFYPGHLVVLIVIHHWL
jgi:hypothetical protein